MKLSNRGHRRCKDQGNAALMALLQQAIAPEMQRRVWALCGSLAGAAMPLGLVIAGPLADTVGVRALYIVSGILYILLGVGAFFCAGDHAQRQPARPGCRRGMSIGCRQHRSLLQGGVSAQGGCHAKMNGRMTGNCASISIAELKR